MPAARTFSYEHLLLLMREHPDWSMNEYADALTRHERTTDPGHPRVNPSSVAAAISRYRETWAEQGYFVRARKAGVRLLPWVNIPDGHWMDTPLRRLRVLERISKNEEIGDPATVRWALKFERDLRSRRQVVDLSPGGKPYIRAARRDEVDGTGELIALTAKFPGLTDRQWELMAPEQRAAASARWLPDSDRVRV